MKKMFKTLGILTVLFALLLTSCQQDRKEDQPLGGNQSVSIVDLKKHLSPVTGGLPEAVQQQIESSKANLEKYTGNNLRIEGTEILGTIHSEAGAAVAKTLLASKNTTVASGNLMEMESFTLFKLSELGSAQDAETASQNISEMTRTLITSGMQVMEISWSYGNKQFKSLCIYNQHGIVYDTAIVGIVIMDKEGVTAESNDHLAKAAWRWVSSTWTANWLWGSKRGEKGYKITIYYNGSTVSSVDRSDWGHISLGKAQSHSKTLKNSGSYGKIQYALGLCTPVGSLSLDTKYFKVSFSGLGSNIVANGTRSLYP